MNHYEPMPADLDGYDLSGLKVPPHSLEAEQSVIGGLLIGADFDAVAELVSAEDFYRTEHRLAFAAIAKLAEAGKPIDLVTVCDALSASGDLDRAGGLVGLAEIAKDTPSAANVRAYAAAVKERAALRNLIRVGQRIAESGFEPDGRKAVELIDDAQAEIIALGDNGGAEQDFHVSASLKAYTEELERRFNSDGLVGLSTGFAAIDERTNGLMGGDLMIVGGRPKSGKTTFAMNIAGHVAVQLGKPVLVFSMEMSRIQLIDRMVSSIGKIPFSMLRNGTAFDSEHTVKIIPTVSRIKDSPLFIDDRAALTVAQMRSAARRQHRKTPLSLIVVDYLQLAKAKADGRVMEITMISQGLKALAKELDVPVIALSQLSRKCEEQKRKPQASDLRDSGSIEQDADGIFLIYRDEVYNEDSPMKGVAEIICAALRNGEAGHDYLGSELGLCRFVNADAAEIHRKLQQQEKPTKKTSGRFEY